MSERAKRLVKCAKESKIPPPFAKMIELNMSDSVDDDKRGENDDRDSFPRAKPDLLEESIPQPQTDDGLKTYTENVFSSKNPDDCLEREMSPKMTSRCNSRSNSLKSSSSNSSESSSSSSSSSSPTPNDSSRLTNISTPINPIASAGIATTELVTPKFQPKARTHDDSILEPGSSGPKPDVSYNNKENVIKCVESTDCKDFSPDDSGDEYRPERHRRRKLKHRYISSSTNSSSNDSTANVFTQEEISSFIVVMTNHSVCSDQNKPLSLQQSLSNIETKELSHDDQNAPTKNRKRKIRNEADWKKVKTKPLKNTGQQYTTRSGKTVNAKEIKPACSDKCRYACAKNFPEEQRREIFQMYWALGTLQRQRDFLNSTITVLQPVQRRLKEGASKNRKPNTYYSLVKESRSLRVCKTFLLNTLNISERTLRTVIEFSTENSSVGNAPSNKRGKHDKHSKVAPEVLESVRNHIKSISKIESHYLRAHTTREYIDGGLTIADLHRVYKKERESENKIAATYDLYFRIFNGEFNISFFVPKKDQCDVCESYKNDY